MRFEDVLYAGLEPDDYDSVVHSFPKGALRPSIEESINFHETDNIFIEGENLEALKILLRRFSEAIKMIYIDPPYNTKEAFIYHDSFGKDKGSCTWLRMMSVRLYIARQLLRDDGVIFISIDDREMAYLKVLCDSIFGRNKFLGCFVWKRSVTKHTSRTNISRDHEYILAYKKKEARLRGEEKDFSHYTNPDNDPLGDWKLESLESLSSPFERPNQFYLLRDPLTGIEYSPSARRSWAYSCENMEKLIKENRIVFPTKNSRRPKRKKYRGELLSERSPFSTLIKTSLNNTATRELDKLLGNTFFSYPKSLDLMKQLIVQGADKDSIILDFFAGSATTGHAVMELNAEDEGRRKYICIQNGERCPSDSSYESIAEIAKARLRASIKKIKEENPEISSKIDLGFKVFKLEIPAGALETVPTMEEREEI